MSIDSMRILRPVEVTRNVGTTTKRMSYCRWSLELEGRGLMKIRDVLFVLYHHRLKTEPGYHGSRPRSVVT
jgi:hypothetical protein